MLDTQHDAPLKCYIALGDNKHVSRKRVGLNRFERRTKHPRQVDGDTGPPIRILVEGGHREILEDW